MPVDARRCFPGFADAADDQPWSVRATIRLYADSSVALAPARRARPASHRARRRRPRADFALPASPWPLPPGFVPLGLLVARVGEQVLDPGESASRRDGAGP